MRVRPAKKYREALKQEDYGVPVCIIFIGASSTLLKFKPGYWEGHDVDCFDSPMSSSSSRSDEKLSTSHQ
jgi:hypothetical protein